MTTRQFCLFTVLILVTQWVQANCRAVFPQAASSYASDGLISFQRNAALLNTSSRLDIAFIDDRSGGFSCGFTDCTTSGRTSANLQLPPFQISQSIDYYWLGRNQSDTLPAADYVDVHLGRNSILRLTNGSYRIEQLRAERGSWLILSEGEYWIEDLYLGRDTVVSTFFGEKVVLHVRNLRLGRNASINFGGSPNNLIVAAYDSIVLGNNSEVVGYLSAQNDIQLNNNAYVYGALNARDIIMRRNAEVFYASLSVNFADFGNLCGNTPSVNHIRFEHDGNGLTCEAETVKITACADASCSTTYNRPLDIVLSPSGWVGGNRIRFTRSTNAQLAIKTPSTVTLRATGYKTRCSGGFGSSCDITFADAGFRFFGTSPNTPVPVQTAEQNFVNVNIQAVKNQNGVCKAALRGRQRVNVAATYHNPATGSTTLRGTGNLIPTFDADGHANIPNLNYADAGLLRLSAQANINGANIAQGSTVVTVKPDQLTLALMPNFPTYPLAGKTYPVNVIAKGAAGGVLPNYQAGQLQIALTRTSGSYDGQFQFSGTLDNSSGNFVNLNHTPFVQGKLRVNDFYYAEAGNIRVQVKDANYFGNPVNGTPLAISEFIPERFSINAAPVPRMLNRCASGNFTYFGDEFALSVNPQITLIARNARFHTEGLSPSDTSSITRNYNYAGLTPDYAPLEKSGYSGTVTVTVDPLNAVTLPNNAGLRVPLENVQVKYHKRATAEPPRAASINMLFDAADLTDATHNSLCYKANGNLCSDFSFENDINGVTLRYGRLQIADTYGPQTLPLQVPLTTQYWNTANTWQHNQQDNCTAYNFSMGSSLSLSAISGNDLTNRVGNVTASGTMVGGRAANSSDLRLTAPNLSGELLLQLIPGTSTPDWATSLNIDWNNDGQINANDKPSAAVQFGIYRGNDRVIHWREVF